MGNIVARAGTEPTSLAFRARVLPLHRIGFPDVTAIPMPTCLCSSLPQRSVHTTTIVYPKMHNSIATNGYQHTLTVTRGVWRVKCVTHASFCLPPSILGEMKKRREFYAKHPVPGKLAFFLTYYFCK